MYLLGIDIGTSSVKVSVVDAFTQQVVDSALYPETEAPISSPHPGWAEQDPEHWWAYTISALEKIKNNGIVVLTDISAIGIAYQMHGLVMVDAEHQVIRPAIIWCDSRAVSYGEKAFDAMGKEYALKHLLNSPGNFTASKLAWVKENQPQIFEKCKYIMLPGDYIAMKLSGEVSTTNTALSEGIFWDFQTNSVSSDILKIFGFEGSIIPPVKPVFSIHATVSKTSALETGLKVGTPISYKAGDQPNNALSLNVFEPGEVAATAGTSGVVYAVTDKTSFDSESRINTFAHVSHQQNDLTRLGLLACINGTGIANAWIRKNFGEGLNYPQMNILANTAPIGSKNLLFFPFGNGVERILNNHNLPSIFYGMNFNIHNRNHIFRATQEGIAFALNYALEVIQKIGSPFKVMKVGKANLFLSNVFTETLVNCSGIPIEMYNTTGAKGAALGAGIGTGVYNSNKEAFEFLEKTNIIEPDNFQKEQATEAYQIWKATLNKNLL